VKNVKKKKRSSNIGAGRQDDDEQENDIQSPPPIPSINQVVTQIKETTAYEETTRDSLSELPPPPLPPLNPIPAVQVISQYVSSTNVSTEIVSPPNSDVTALGAPPLQLEEIPLLKRSYTGLHDTSPRDDPIQNEKVISEQINSTPKNLLSNSKGWDNTQKIADDEYSNFDATVRNLGQVKDNSLKELREAQREIEKEEQLLRNLQLKLSEQEKEQQKLAEQEEFEKADVLSTAIDKLRGDIEIHQKNIVKLNTNASNAERKVEQATGAHDAAVIKVLNSLQDFSNKILLEKSKILEASKEKHDKEDTRLRAEEERISLEQKHVEKAEEVLEEELRTTEDAIQAQSGDAVAQEAEMAEKLTLVSMEIDALEAQLAAKREEEKKLKIEMTAIQGKVFEVRKKYDRQLKNIKERKEVIEINKYECHKEKSLLDTERASLDKDIERVSSLVEEMDKQKESVTFDIQIIEILQKSQRNNVTSTSGSEKVPVVNDEFKHALTEASMAIADAINQQTALTKRVELLGLENRDIDDKIPKLETEKKAHAAAKRFKEAAAVAKDIQTFKTKQEENIKEIDEITSEIPKHADIVFALRQKEVEAKAKLLAAQKDEDIIRFNKLQKRAKELQVARRKIIGINESAKLKACCLYSIDTELNGVLSDANIIKDEHGLTDSLEDDGVDEDVDAKVAETVDDSNDKIDAEVIATDRNETAVEVEDCVPAITETYIEETAVSDTTSVPEPVESDESIENSQALEQAKYLIQVIAETEKLLSEVIITENYEDAAVYQEKLEEITQLLQTQLIALRLTEDDVRKMM